ncbi:hypothetical protein FSP39_025149 [Pinctada imbricata]|uniref:Jacalin-type lectin domain-containing protein n=1 Tax=Pinctada imbricata TaxID=66713 RepID=A0AA88XPN8_PINIB|nr:hypothetical protein FSP39_025149 [Pinctada imbricata]
MESSSNLISTRDDVILGLHEPNTADFIGGRTGGNPFNDCSSWKGRDITAVRLGCSTVFLFYIQLKYGDTWAPQHGLQDGCDPESLYGVRSIQNVTYDLDPSEYVTSISGTSHPTRTYVQSITFRTNKRTLPRCGPEDGVKKTVNGSHLLYISGRKGCVIDGIELHWLQ